MSPHNELIIAGVDIMTELKSEGVNIRMGLAGAPF